MDNILNQIKVFPMVATLLSLEQIKEIGEDNIAKAIEQGEAYQKKFNEKCSINMKTLEELEAKAVISGLTPAEKVEYKKLKGIK